MACALDFVFALGLGAKRIYRLNNLPNAWLALGQSETSRDGERERGSLGRKWNPIMKL